MSKQPPPAPTARAIGPCPTIIQNVGRPGGKTLTEWMSYSRVLEIHRRDTRRTEMLHD